ncbi:ATP-dependent DNA helicase RecG [Specibacter cremeus]|uniref:ATP-dependent DNA helicase RecG n=1 Tax=Specibacter cremeus TaxID=1629051 RepID=UPI000F77F4B6|nr:ATP-dependent DNA helicase RecG [Specibacter cremeus]
MSSSDPFDTGPSLDELNIPLVRLVGKTSADVIERELGLTTAGELLHHFPRRYLKLGELTDLEALENPWRSSPSDSEPGGDAGDPGPDDEVTIVARVVRATTRRMNNRPGNITEVTITDGTGRPSKVRIALFNAYQAMRELQPGVLAMFSGKIKNYRGTVSLAGPKYALLPDDELAEHEAELHVAKPIPVYPAAGKLPSWRIQNVIETLLGVMDLTKIPDPIPAGIVSREGFSPLPEAYLALHEPSLEADWQRAIKRFRYQEALALQTALAQRRDQTRNSPATARPGLPAGLLSAFDAGLPYTLTDGQRTLGSLFSAELSAPHPMNRLLQGEVGSGKTLVALRAMLQVIDSGGQAAFLAPTEVLAGQHYTSISTLLGTLGSGTLLGGPHATTVTLLTGSMPAAARKKAMLAAASGEAGIVIGTHALLSDTVTFADLGMIVVDEQHRFGVEQRDALRAKAAKPPHLLVMTATPIPRTVAMTVFGDLEVSELKELPAGRAPINTHVVALAEHPGWEARLWTRSREEVDAGRQVYVVCPKIGDEDQVSTGSTTGDRARRDQVSTGSTTGVSTGSTSGDRARRDQVSTGSTTGVSTGSTTGDGDQRAMAGVLAVVQYLRTVPALAGLRIEPLHGRLDPADKTATMADFAAGGIDVLVATTVIEVGVDVHNATLMIVLDADRFGMSQLHQLRGRVGRGGHAGTCLLETGLPAGHPSRRRLAAVAATTDGFELAQEDVRMRREGDILGASQSGGRRSMRFLQVLSNADVIEQARADACLIVEEDPQLARHPALAYEIATYLTDETEAFLERG